MNAQHYHSLRVFLTKHRTEARKVVKSYTVAIQHLDALFKGPKQKRASIDTEELRERFTLLMKQGGAK